ncbi:MAG: site-2 protease family protein [Oscillospiraceae bacterium]|nr:site-2 protease family protein [Oscillospiraceae bacterium]
MKDRVVYSLAAVLLWLYVYYTGQAEMIPVVLIPVVIHELAHVLAILCLGMRIRAVRLELRGLCIEYSGDGGWTEHAIAAAAGPVAGFFYAAAAGALSRSGYGQWLRLSGEISFLLSAFNLIPVYPLDGGRIFFALAETFLEGDSGEILFRAVGNIAITVMLCAGVYLICRAHVTALLAASLWLLLLQNEQMPLVKGREIS